MFSFVALREMKRHWCSSPEPVDAQLPHSYSVHTEEVSLQCGTSESQEFHVQLLANPGTSFCRGSFKKRSQRDDCGLHAGSSALHSPAIPGYLHALLVDFTQLTLKVLELLVSYFQLLPYEAYFLCQRAPYFVM